jgi:guanylate cyclase
MVLYSLRPAAVWFVFFAASILIAASMSQWVDPTYVLTDLDRELALNIIGAMTFTFLVMGYFVKQRNRFQQRSDDLLHNILPNAIAARLKDDDTLIADDVADATVLFADIVEFTPLSAKLSASELIGLLNAVFETLDGLVDELGLEKIKTVGDEYMVAGGVPDPSDDHAQSIATLALRIRDALANTTFDGHSIEMRIGIDSGPVVAGVIGHRKFAYDLWGETVNTASRMESTGEAGRIQITAATHSRIKDLFSCEPRYGVDVKGIGTMDTFFLNARI